MGLETDIYNEVYTALRSYRQTELDYVRGWFQHNALNIPSSQLPAVTLYPATVETQSRHGKGDRFVLELVCRGSVQHFDPQQASQGARGRTGTLDLYYNLDRVLFTILPFQEVTVNSVTTTTQVHPIFSTVDAVRDVMIGNSDFSSVTQNDEYPNLDVSIPIRVFYIKTDVVRRIT
jgi:hypothetical protein